MASDNPTDSNDPQEGGDAPAPEEGGDATADESAAQENAAPEDAAEQYSPDELNDGPAPPQKKGADVNLELVLDVPVDVALRVGSTDISIRDLVALVEGSVISLDKGASEPMDVMVNGMLIAHGEIVVVDDKFGVHLTDVISPVERIESLN